MNITNLEQARSVVTPDGLEVRPLAESASAQSLAQTTLPVGGETPTHYHELGEELCYFVGGSGQLRVADEQREVGVGDCAVIPPGVVHKLSNSGDEPLVVITCSSPPHRRDDMVVVDDA